MVLFALCLVGRLGSFEALMRKEGLTRNSTKRGCRLLMFLVEGSKKGRQFRLLGAGERKFKQRGVPLEKERAGATRRWSREGAGSGETGDEEGGAQAGVVR